MTIQEYKKLYEDKKDEVSYLRNQNSGLNYSVVLYRNEIDELRQEIEELKKEKAALLQENVELLEKMRSVLKSEVGADGN